MSKPNFSAVLPPSTLAQIDDLKPLFNGNKTQIIIRAISELYKKEFPTMIDYKGRLTPGTVVNGVKLVAGEQILIDGKPAVLKTKGGALMAFAPHTPRPLELWGQPVVGQWADKWLDVGQAATQTYLAANYPSGSNRVRLAPNPDSATHIDYAAWVAAFDKVYSES